MKLALAALALLSMTAFAQPNPDEHEINRRNFLSLNTDLSEIKLVVHYPGGSPITEVCGLQLRTNVVGFANSHLEEVLKEIQLLDETGLELIAVQRVAEPPHFVLQPRNVMLVGYKIRTKSGKSLKSAVRAAAEAAGSKIDGEPDVIIMARHCQDKS